MLEKGQFVISKMGRDKGKVFICYEVISPNRCLIVDGKYHKLDKPKLKNIKHLQEINKFTKILNELNHKDLQSQNKRILKEIENLDISM